jgi:two-component system, NtrC family, sensor histidine kinase HydH
VRPLSSLTNRIFLACVLLAMLALGFASYFVNARVTTEAEAELRRGLHEASQLVDQHRSALIDTYTRFARLIADLPRFKAAVEIQDEPTIRPLAAEYRQQINAASVVVRHRDGRVLGADGVGPVENAPVFAPADTAEVSFLHPHERGLLQVVSVPIFVGLERPDVFGRLSVGFLLDDGLAQQFKEVTGSEVAFASGNRVVASTFPRSARAALVPALRAQGVSSVIVEGEEYFALRRPLAGASDPHAPAALILRSRTARLQFLRTIRNGLVGALIATVLLATIVSYVLARTVTRPLAAITSAMRHVAATGDLTRKVSLQSRTGDDEDARLLATTFNTLTDSIATFQREAAQKERLSSLGRLATVIAHEVRNPLMIIRTSLRSLGREGVTSEEIREAAADIDEETSRLNRIVTEVLDFARPIRFDYAPARVNAVCAASAQATEAGDAGPPITLDLDPTDPQIVTDAERLRTALVNILTNARHAVEGTSRVREGAGVAVMSEPLVTLRTRAGGDRVTITIADRGVGIAPEDMAHIFDPYFTTRRTGTGLGLPIARNIVDGLGGTIAVTSEPGVGTEMRLDLPQHPAAA